MVRFVDGPVHAFDLTVGPGMIDLGQPVFNAVKGDCPVSFGAFTLAELNAVIRQVWILEGAALVKLSRKSLAMIRVARG
jgi:hypothetical protein